MHRAFTTASELRTSLEGKEQHVMREREAIDRENYSEVQLLLGNNEVALEEARIAHLTAAALPDEFEYRKQLSRACLGDIIAESKPGNEGIGLLKSVYCWWKNRHGPVSTDAYDSAKGSRDAVRPLFYHAHILDDQANLEEVAADCRQIRHWAGSPVGTPPTSQFVAINLANLGTAISRKTVINEAEIAEADECTEKSVLLLVLSQQLYHIPRGLTARAEFLIRARRFQEAKDHLDHLDGLLFDLDDMKLYRDNYHILKVELILAQGGNSVEVTNLLDEMNHSGFTRHAGWIEDLKRTKPRCTPFHLSS